MPQARSSFLVPCLSFCFCDPMNPMEEPFFSVITPSWNQGKFLRACIGSVVNQNDADFEHLIFDNCSTDETAAVAAEFPHVKFVSEPDRGQSHAVNKGLSAARGEIICWLNSDDEYDPGAFAKLREVFSDPAVQVVFGDVRRAESLIPASIWSAGGVRGSSCTSRRFFSAGRRRGRPARCEKTFTSRWTTSCGGGCRKNIISDTSRKYWRSSTVSRIPKRSGRGPRRSSNERGFSLLITA